MLAFGGIQKKHVVLFKEKYWVCGHLVCPTDLIFFLKDTSAGCFECLQIIILSPSFPLTTSFCQMPEGRHLFSSTQNSLASIREKWLGFVKNMRKMHPPGKVRCHKCRGALIHCYQNVTTRYAMNKKRVLLLLLAFLLAYFAGCGKQVEKPEKIKDIEYTVQEESQVPEELLAKMKEKQKETFQMTYATEGYLYIAKGYGTQKTSGYSIRVTDAYEAAEGIVFSTELLGPGKEEPVLQVETYPYIVVKLKDIGLDVLFQ